MIIAKEISVDKKYGTHFESRICHFHKTFYSANISIQINIDLLFRNTTYLHQRINGIYQKLRFINFIYLLIYFHKI